MSSSWAADLRASLALDLRSLALLRVMLAAHLLADALCGLFSAALLYGDSGLLSRGDALTIMGPAQISLHLLNGSDGFALLLTLIRAGAAAALLLGWRTRAATALSWLLLVSAAARNPLVLTAADGLAIMLLFWGMFLPWNARWSVDAAYQAADARLPTPFFSWAGLALLVQILLLPLLAGLAQGGGGGAAGAGPAWTHTALLSLQALCLVLGLAPGFGVRPRRVALMLFLFSGVLMSIVFDTGLAIWVALGAAAVLIDAGIWDRLAPDPAGGELRLYVARDAHAARRMALLLREFLCLPRTQVLDSQGSPRAARLMPPAQILVLIDRIDAAHLDGAGLAVALAHSPLLRPLRAQLTRPGAGAVGSRLLALMLSCLPNTPVSEHGAMRVLARPERRGTKLMVMVLAMSSMVWQLCRLETLPRSPGDLLRAPLSIVGLDQAWIGPSSTSDSWIAVPAETATGTELDARAPGAQPANFGSAQIAFAPGTRGDAYERSLMAPQAGLARSALARRLCAGHEPRLARLRIVRVTRTAPGAESSTEQHVLLRHDCQ